MNDYIIDNIETPGYWMALGAHGPQLYGDKPYVDSHCRDVVNLLVSFGYDSVDWIDSGWLHDSVEDTTLTIDTVRAKRGAVVADLVWAVTGVGENRKARNADMHRKVAAFPRAAILKTADRISNMVSARSLDDQGLFRMYMKEFEAFVDLVKPHIPSTMLDRLRAAAR